MPALNWRAVSLTLAATALAAVAITGKSPGQATIAHHPGDVEVFDDEPIVGLDQLVGHLVQEMAAHVGDVIVMPGQLRGGLAAVNRSFLRAGQLLGEVTLLFHPRGKRFGRIGDPGDFAAVGGSGN